MFTKTVHAYVRVSTDDQTTEQQVQAIQNAYTPDTHFEWFIEKESGWEGKRSEYDLLLRLIEKGSVKELCSFSVSRLGRDTRKGFLLIDLCQRKGVKVRVLSENLDFSNVMGMALYTLFAALSQMDSDRKSIVIKQKFRLQKEQGIFIAHGNIKNSVSEKVKLKSVEAYNMLDANKPYRYIASVLGISVNTVEKLVRRKGLGLFTRKEFAKRYPGWYKLPKHELDALCDAPWID